jgi:hypothetical protein
MIEQREANLTLRCIGVVSSSRSTNDTRWRLTC